MDAKALVRDGYDKVSYAYRAENGAGHTHDYKTWVEHLCQDLEANLHVLDLGCGCGVPVAQILAARGQVTGVDISPVQIRRAQQLLPQGRFICEDMAKVDFPTASFDAVIAFYAITHVPVQEQQTLFGRIAAWLKPGGFFLGTLGAKAGAGTLQNWLGVQGASMYWSQTDAPTYRRWLKEFGFEILRDELVLEGNIGHQLFYAKRLV